MPQIAVRDLVSEGPSAPETFYRANLEQETKQEALGSVGLAVGGIPIERSGGCSVGIRTQPNK